MALPSSSTRLILAERPNPSINDKTWKVDKQNMADLLPTSPTQLLVKLDYVSIDPAMKGWVSAGRSYIEPVEIGATMRAGSIGRVVKVYEGGNQTGFEVGELVRGHFGWTEYALVEAKLCQKATPPPGADALDYMGPLGGTGMTAYFGLLEVGQVKAGETLVVSGAAGAVGSIVCQIGKILGARVIAIAGSADKCDWLEKDLGVDKALNYKSSSFIPEFKKHVGYLDVYFDNVGGDILDFCLTRLNKGARIALCGAISDYGSTPSGLKAYMNLIGQRAKMQGFIVFDYYHRYGEAEKQIAQWMSEGKLKKRYHVVQGLESCPQHLMDLFEGVNMGKMIVRVSKDDGARL